MSDLDERDPAARADPRPPTPPRGWWQVVRAGYTQFNNDQMGLIAAGVAFYAFLSLVPALIAATLVYGLITDPSQVQHQVASVSGVLPASARDLVDQQLTSLAATSRRGLGLGLVASLLLSLWSASGGMSSLVQAVNDAYDERETRSWVHRKALALALTLGAIAFFAVALGLVAVFPAVASALHLPTAARAGLEAARWIAVLVVLAVALAVLYRVAPDRAAPKMSWVSLGAGVAIGLWVVACVVFSLYVDNFASYGKTYGSLAGVVVLLTWLWLSVYAVLLGAEINAVSRTVDPGRPS